MRKFVVATAASLLGSLIVVLALAPAMANASPYIHAHRGGALKTVRATRIAHPPGNERYRLDRLVILVNLRRTSPA